MSAAVIKCDPSKLPVPRLEPTRAYRTKEKPMLDWPAAVASAEIYRESMRNRTPGAWSEDEVSLCKEMYIRGDAWEDIAEAVGRTVRSCHAKMSKEGVLRHFPREPKQVKPPGKNKKWTEDRLNEMMTLLNNGHTRKSVAEIMGESVKTVRTYSWWRKKGKI